MVLATIVFAAFLPSLGNDFNYDDDANIVRNPHYRGLGLQQLRWMFTTFHMGHYQPLSWMSLGLDYLIWKDRPFGYHLTNLILHVANTVLVYWLAIVVIARSNPSAGLTRKRPTGGVRFGAALAALLFAVHPLRVESVAWVTERRDVLSSFFLLATVLAYFRVHRPGPVPRRRGWMVITLLLYTMSLLSRALGVTLPVILLVLDWYPLRRWGGGKGRWLGREARTVWLEKVPFIVLATAAAMVAPLAQRHVGAALSLAEYPVESRIAQACYGVVFYVWKTLVPLGLVPMYELHPPLKLLDPRYLLSALAVIVAVTFLLAVGRRRPAWTVAALCYIIVLLPVLGLAQAGQQETADRYSYLASIAWAVLIGSAVTKFGRLDRLRRSAAAPAIAIGVLVIAGLSILTWRQCKVWKDPYTLWTHATEQGSPCATAHYNLAVLKARQARIPEAVEHFREALRINPRYPEAYYNLGNLLRAQNKNGEALSEYRLALRSDPEYVEAHVNLGNLLRDEGRTEAAIEQYHEAIRISPRHIVAHCNLASTLATDGRDAEAREAIEEALQIDPQHAAARKILTALQRRARTGPE